MINQILKGSFLNEPALIAMLIDHSNFQYKTKYRNFTVMLLYT